MMTRWCHTVPYEEKILQKCNHRWERIAKNNRTTRSLNGKKAQMVRILTTSSIRFLKEMTCSSGRRSNQLVDAANQKASSRITQCGLPICHLSWGGNPQEILQIRSTKSIKYSTKHKRSQTIQSEGTTRTLKIEDTIQARHQTMSENLERMGSIRIPKIRKTSIKILFRMMLKCQMSNLSQLGSKVTLRPSSRRTRRATTWRLLVPTHKRA